MFSTYKQKRNRIKSIVKVAFIKIAKIAQNAQLLSPILITLIPRNQVFLITTSIKYSNISGCDFGL